MRFPQTQVIAFCHGLHNATARSAAASARSGPLQRSLLHQTSAAFRPRQRFFFTSNLRLAKDGSTESHAPAAADPKSEQPGHQKETKEQKDQKDQKEQSGHAAGSSSSSNGNGNGSHSRRKSKGPAGGAKKKLRDPLRRVASIAQRSNRKPAKATKNGESEPDKDYGTTICAICVAESFDMKRVPGALPHYYELDPDGLDFDDSEVVHLRPRGTGGHGDIFVFETGTVVTWSLPPEAGIELATKFLVGAHENPHTAIMDRDDMTERLEFEIDPSTPNNSMRGDTVVLGAATPAGNNAEGRFDPTDAGRAKIAFSSGLARSTKVAVLETLLNSFLERTEAFPSQLKSGRKLRVRKNEILRLTGEVQHLRSQLNFFSELTDSLPDKFWDQRSDLKLDGIYDQVGKALDVGSRIRVLNQRMDYADNMLGTLRDMLDQQHGSFLEWIIIWLIAIEIVFHLLDWTREYRKVVNKGERKASSYDFLEWMGLVGWWE